MDLPFKYISCLGHGSFGVVLQAKNTTGSHSAVKIIFPNGNPEESKNLNRECEITKGKDHPNIVKIINVFETVFTTTDEFEKIALLVADDEFHDKLNIYKGRIERKKTIPVVLIEMELCGVTLREWLVENVNNDKKDLKLQLTQIQIIKDMISGMQFLHENKIIHRDFKPENVLFSLPNKEDKFPFPLKIGDFGLCRILHSEESKTSTLSSRTGTLDYMAPEMDGNEYNFQCDIYSLGLVIWEVSQLIPFKGRKKIFNNLIFDEQNDLVVSFLPNITSTIISMTKRKIVDRMKSITELIIETGELNTTISDFLRQINNHAEEIALFLSLKDIRHGFFGLVLKDNSISSHSEKIKSLKYQIIKEKRHQNSPNVYQTVFTNVNEIEQVAKLVNHEKSYLFGTIPKNKELFGATLRDWLNQHVSHDKEDLTLQLTQVKIVQDMINGMQFLHENKIIHRDFKPENVMFSPQVEENSKFPLPVKIKDFGLCRILHSEESKTSALTSGMGTLDYMAPEMNENEYNFQSDIFSLGLVIWEVVQLIPFDRRKKLFHELVYDNKTKLVVSFEPSISSTIISMTKRKLDERMKSIIEFDGINDSPITLFKGQLDQLTTTTVQNGQEFKEILFKCSAGDIINLTEGEFEGPFKINCSELKIIGQGSKTVLKCHTEKEIIIEICGNNNCVSNIDIIYTSDGVKLIGSGNSIFNVGLIRHDNISLTSALKIKGSRNKIARLKISGSDFFQRNKWMNKPYATGIASIGDYNTIENIEINNLHYGITLSDSYNTVTNVIFNNTIQGIDIRGSQNKICTIKYIRGNSVTENYECYGVIVIDSKNDFEDIHCTGMGIEGWGFYIDSDLAEKCKISNSSCGPLLINGSEHTLINVDCGSSIHLTGMGHKLIKCKGKQLLKNKQHSQTFVLENNNFDEVVDFEDLDFLY